MSQHHFKQACAAFTYCSSLMGHYLNVLANEWHWCQICLVYYSTVQLKCYTCKSVWVVIRNGGADWPWTLVQSHRFCQCGDRAGLHLCSSDTHGSRQAQTPPEPSPAPPRTAPPTLRMNKWMKEWRRKTYFISDITSSVKRHKVLIAIEPEGWLVLSEGSNKQ